MDVEIQMGRNEVESSQCGLKQEVGFAVKVMKVTEIIIIKIIIKVIIQMVINFVLMKMIVKYFVVIKLDIKK